MPRRPQDGGMQMTESRVRELIRAFLTQETRNLRQRPTTAVAAAYTASYSDSYIECDATSAAFTVTLPAAGGHDGHTFDIKKVDSTANAVTIDGNGSETIDGATTQALSSQWDSFTVLAVAGDWKII